MYKNNQERLIQISIFTSDALFELQFANLSSLLSLFIVCFSKEVEQTDVLQ